MIRGERKTGGWLVEIGNKRRRKGRRSYLLGDGVRGRAGGVIDASALPGSGCRHQKVEGRGVRCAAAILGCVVNRHICFAYPMN